MGARILLLGVAASAFSALQAAYAAQPIGVFGIDPPHAARLSPLHAADAPDLSALSEAYRLPESHVRPGGPALRDPGHVPSSVELTLGALATLGVARGLRALKYTACVRCRPDWYCDLAAASNHAAPLELNVTFFTTCPFRRPLPLVPLIVQRPYAEREIGSAASIELLVETPRGPPAASPPTSALLW